MESRNTAIALLIVMGIVCLGVYVAISTLMSGSQEPIIRLGPEPTFTPFLGVRTTPSPAPGRGTPEPTPTPVLILPPTLVLSSPQPQATPTRSPGIPILTPTATRTPTRAYPTNTPTPTLLPVGYVYVLSGTVRDDPEGGYGGCMSHRIYGYVTDKNGVGLEGVIVERRSAWTPPIPATTKGGTEKGFYDHVLGPDPVTWELVIVDGTGQRLSPIVKVPHLVSGSSMACWHRVDWAKTK